LPAVQKSIPRPEALRNGHCGEFYRYEKKEKPTEAQGEARTLKPCVDARPRDNGELDHARIPL